MRPFDFTPYRGLVWRFVEDQNTSSTMKLVDSIDEQRILEELLDDTKPPVPVACQHLHYLQFTPFRYPAHHATRFRERGGREGVFYASEALETSAAEVAFYRILFFWESPETEPPSDPFEMTAFACKVQSDVAVDLVPEQIDPATDRFMDPVDYTDCHRLARDARERSVQVIRFRSVRDREHRANVAVLDCAAFAESHIRQQEGWWFRFGPKGLFAVKRFGEGRMEFNYDQFERDPRINI